MSKRKLIISITAAILVLATVSCCFVGCVDIKDIFNKPAEETPSTDNTPQEGDELVVEAVESSGATMVLSPMASTRHSETFLLQSIGAEFVGTEPEIKKLNWSIEWAEPEKHIDEYIGDYLTLHEYEWNELYYDIRCHKGFDGEAIITATTLDGQYSASATIVYRGFPRWINLITHTSVMQNVPEWNKDMYVLNSESSMSYEIELDNELHDVRVDFGLAAINATAYGGMVFEKVEYDAAGNVVWSEFIDCPLILSEDWSSDGGVNGYYLPFDGTDAASSDIPQFFAYVEGEEFIIESYNPFGQILEADLSEGGKLVCTPVGYIDNKVPYASLQVVENMNGMTGFADVAFAAPYQGPIRFTQEYIFF